TILSRSPLYRSPTGATGAFPLWFANIRSARNRLTLNGWGRTIGLMPAFLLLLFRFLRLLLSGHQAVAIENAALRMQIAAFQRKKKPPGLTTFDRMFWISVPQLLAGMATSPDVRPGRHRR